MMEAILDDEWQTLFNWGVEGEDYMVDDDGMFYRTQEQRDKLEEVDWRLANLGNLFTENLPKKEGRYDDGNAYKPEDQATEYKLTLKEIDIEILDAYGVENYAELLGPARPIRIDYPAWQISLGEDTPAAIANQEITEIQDKYLPQIIIVPADEFDTAWEEYVARYDSVDVAAYEQRITEGMAEIRQAYGLE